MISKKRKLPAKGPVNNFEGKPEAPKKFDRNNALQVDLDESMVHDEVAKNVGHSVTDKQRFRPRMI